MLRIAKLLALFVWVAVGLLIGLPITLYWFAQVYLWLRGVTP